LCRCRYVVLSVLITSYALRTNILLCTLLSNTLSVPSCLNAQKTRVKFIAVYFNPYIFRHQIKKKRFRKMATIKKEANSKFLNVKKRNKIYETDFVNIGFRIIFTVDSVSKTEFG
jgi:hypothetical protein